MSLGHTTGRTFVALFCVFSSQPSGVNGNDGVVSESVLSDEDSTLLCTLPRAFPVASTDIDPSIFSLPEVAKVSLQLVVLSHRRVYGQFLYCYEKSTWMFPHPKSAKGTLARDLVSGALQIAPHSVTHPSFTRSLCRKGVTHSSASLFLFLPFVCSRVLDVRQLVRKGGCAATAKT